MSGRAASQITSQQQLDGSLRIVRALKLRVGCAYHTAREEPYLSHGQ